MKRKNLLVLVFAAALVLPLGAYSWFHRGDPPLTASGTLEARNINVGSKEGGRVTKVLASEGDRLEANQLLVTFEDAELAARLLQSRGKLEQAQANLAKMLHGSRPEEIEEAQAAGRLPDGSKGYRAEEIAQSQADLARARADMANAQINFDRTKQLADAGVYSRQQLDDASARLDMAKAQVESLEHGVTVAQGRLREASAVQKRTERGSRVEDIASARAAVTLAQGELDEAEADDLGSRSHLVTSVVPPRHHGRPDGNDTSAEGSFQSSHSCVVHSPRLHRLPAGFPRPHEARDPSHSLVESLPAIAKLQRCEAGVLQGPGKSQDRRHEFLERQRCRALVPSDRGATVPKRGQKAKPC